jgi:hypothetical protein
MPANYKTYSNIVVDKNTKVKKEAVLSQNSIPKNCNMMKNLCI